MKSVSTLNTTALFSVLVMATYFADATSQYPEAYPGLNPGAYNHITLNNNKASGSSFQINGVTIELNKDDASSQKNQNFTFSKSIPGGSISATQGNNSLFGQMHLHNKHYILTTNQAGIWAVELPESGISYNDCGMDHSEHANKHDFSHHNFKAVPTNNNTINAAGTIIDVLVIYDQAIADRYPGDLLQTRVDQYFNVSNQTYANSAIDLAIRQVGLEQVGYNFNDANEGLRDLIIQTLQFGVGTRGLETLPQLYNESGADLVIFLRTHNIETRGNCGIAKFPKQVNGEFNTFFGVNVMADGMSSWSLCTDQLMVHEIGHNLGAGHNNTTVDQRYIPDAAGFAKLGQYGTAMGSFGTGDPNRFLELDYFSNPNVQCGGGPCGVDGQRNNANIINQLMGPVSNYQNSVSNAPLPPDFTVALIDQDGDGVLDRDDEFPFDASETTDSDGDGVGDNGDAFPNNNAETLDFDGDGIGNNGDSDDDQDGILDFDDDFPLNPNEVKDSDRDGVGDIADEFVFESDEFLDSDGDGTGNNSDADDDNDGVNDVDVIKQDLLVISVGNNRILRFDAQTGLAKGIEVLPSDGLLTFQSDLTYDNEKQLLYYITQSSIKTLDLMNRENKSKTILPAFSDSLTSLGTGFPTALQADTGDALYVTTLRANLLRNYLTENQQEPAFFFNVFMPVTPPESEFENFIDLEELNGELFTLGQFNRVYRGNLNGSNFRQIGNATMSWLVDPYAFVVTDETMLIHTDQSRNKLVITDGDDGSFAGIFADIAELGYSNPTGIDITNDGRLLVAVADQNAILEFDLETEEFLGELVKGFGLDQPHKMVLVPQLQDRFHQDADKVMRPNAGNWFNPATSGRGYNVGIFNNRLQVLWFTYDDDGLPIWYTSAGILDGFTFTADILKTQLSSSGEFSFATVGNINIEFDNERQATVNWQLGNNSDTEAITWLQTSGEPDVAAYTGMWSRPDTPGWGVAVSTIGDVSFAIPFIYDDLGEPRWTISDVFTGSSPLQFNMDTVFSEGLCPSCSGAISTSRSPSGTTTLVLNNSDASWSSDIMWADPIPGGWQLDQTEVIRISSEPTRPR